MLKISRCSILAISLVLTGTILHVDASCRCYEIISQEHVEFSDIEFASNQRYPQTVIYDIVTDHLFQKPSSKEKKILILGYDGFREDALENVMGMERSAVRTVSDQGGLYHSYAGADGRQNTNTPSGWQAMLCGKWAYEQSNQKPEEVSTFLDQAVKNGYSSAFIASWTPHVDGSLQGDGNHPVYQKTEDDRETRSELHAVLSDTSADSYDVVYTVLEHTDHAGESAGYGNHIEEYTGTSQQVDRQAYDLLQTIRQRESYEREDWLIIVTSDQGGADDRNTWFAVNKDLNLT